MVSCDRIEPSPMDWTPEAIAWFWDLYSRRPELEANYFSKMVAAALVNLLRMIGPLCGARILDYGCGEGHLAGLLLDHGATVNGADVSPASVAQANTRFDGRAGWDGAAVIQEGRVLSWADDSFDRVSCIETIEHVPAPARQVIFEELLRLVRPGGCVLYTTPFEEDLRLETVVCPNCRTEFHRVQHLHSYTAEGLRAMLEATGYEVLFCRGIAIEDLNDEPLLSWKHWSPSYLRFQTRYRLARALDRISPSAFPNQRVLNSAVRAGKHLVAVGRKPVAG